MILCLKGFRTFFDGLTGTGSVRAGSAGTKFVENHKADRTSDRVCQASGHERSMDHGPAV